MLQFVELNFGFNGKILRDIDEEYTVQRKGFRPNRVHMMKLKQPWKMHRYYVCKLCIGSNVDRIVFVRRRYNKTRTATHSLSATFTADSHIYI